MFGIGENMKYVVVLSGLLFLAGCTTIIYYQSNKRLEEAVSYRDNQIETLQKRINTIILDAKEINNQIKEKEEEQSKLELKEEADAKHFNQTDDKNFNQWGDVVLPPIVADFMLNKKLYR